MPMPALDLFEILIAAAESRNLTDAAQKLRLSQAGVSSKLKELERQSPLPLFSLEGKRKVLTHYGRELYKIAKANRSSMSSLYENLNREYASAETLTLRVGSRRELFEALAPKIKFPGRVQFVALSSTECIQHLQEHKIDVAISYQLPDSPEIMGKKILESSANLVVHKKFLKGKKKRTFPPILFSSRKRRVCFTWKMVICLVNGLLTTKCLSILYGCAESPKTGARCRR
ncbi:MAG: LysR family transcriptional regulator [Bdellovibrionota bacterium]